MQDESEDARHSEDEPLMDRRLGGDRRSGRDRRGKSRGGSDRRQGDRRKTKRSINEYQMDEDVLEFVNAVNRFREKSGNRFPTAQDILGILRDLGYEKRT